MQYVIDAIEVARLLNGGDVRRLLDHAYQPLVACRAGAVRTRIDIRDVVAERAKVQFVLDVVDGGGECLGIAGVRPQDVERQPLRALGSDARQLLELLDESSHRLGELGHQSSPCSPPSIPPRSVCTASSTLRPPSFTAATMRSCNISMSPDFTTSGSMVTFSNCFWPLILMVTDPLPAE